MRRIALSRSLSAKILVLTVACVLLGEVLIYVPSIARFRLNYLQERIAAAQLASLALRPDGCRSSTWTPSTPCWATRACWR